MNQDQFETTFYLVSFTILITYNTTSERQNTHITNFKLIAFGKHACKLTHILTNLLFFRHPKTKSQYSIDEQEQIFWQFSPNNGGKHLMEHPKPV